MKEKLMNIEEAIGLAKDGDLFTTGGVSFHRVPRELIREINQTVQKRPEACRYSSRCQGLRLAYI